MRARGDELRNAIGMSMRPLELDFLETRRPGGWAAWALAAIAAAFVLDVGRTWYVLREEISIREARLLVRADALRDRRLVQVSYKPIRDGELAAARDTIRRLSVPWNGLFDALEAAQTERSTLLSIEPDVANGSVTLTGEAKDYLAALSYVATLQDQKFFSSVHLAKHETRANDPQRPVTFVISGSWKERP